MHSFLQTDIVSMTMLMLGMCDHGQEYLIISALPWGRIEKPFIMQLVLFYGTDETSELFQRTVERLQQASLGATAANPGETLSHTSEAVPSALPISSCYAVCRVRSAMPPAEITVVGRLYVCSAADAPVGHQFVCVVSNRSQTPPDQLPADRYAKPIFPDHNGGELANELHSLRVPQRHLAILPPVPTHSLETLLQHCFPPQAGSAEDLQVSRTFLDTAIQSSILCWMIWVGCALPAFSETLSQSNRKVKPEGRAHAHGRWAALLLCVVCVLNQPWVSIN